MELLTGILFTVSYLIFGFGAEFLIAAIISSFFVIVIVSDINYLVIPDEVTLFFSITVLIIKFIFYGVEVGFESILNGLSLFFTMYLIMLLGNHLFKKESLGGGDIKLMFFVGRILSPINGMFQIFLSSFIALPISLIVYFTKKNRLIPFGPFILLALYIIYILQIDIITLLG
jgi:leader peptidase (prepilin peptidase)/N-methyltransferase